MVSLSTVYGLTIVLGTLAAVGSAFVGTKIYPIQAGGTLEMALAPAAAILPTVTAALKSATSKKEPLNTEVTSTIEEAPKTEVTSTVEEAPKTEVTSTIEEAPKTEAIQEELPSIEENPTAVGGKKVPSWFKRKH